MKASSPNALARAVRAFFEEYLPELRGVSRHTLLSYRDIFALLLRFLAESRHCEVVALDLEAISPDAVLAFLNHLEQGRHNKTSSRNVRLASSSSSPRTACFAGSFLPLRLMATPLRPRRGRRYSAAYRPRSQAR